MQKIFRNALSLCVLLASATALSATTAPTPAVSHSESVTADSGGYPGSTQSLSPLLGFRKSQIGVGVDYEHHAFKPLGFGGFFRFHSKGEGKGEYGFLGMGGFASLHFRTSLFDFNVGPGLGIFSVDGGPEDDTSFGPILKVGMNYRLSDRLSIGFEHDTYFGWLSDKFRSDEDFWAKFSIAF